MVCKNCGAEIGDYSAFCTYCGKPVGNPVVNLAKPGEPEASAPPPGYSQPEPIDGREPLQQPEFGQVPDYNRSSTSWQNNYSGYTPQAAQAALTQTNGSTWQEIRRADCIIDESGQRYGIGWLKFIVYVQLFLSAAISVYNAFSFFSVTGSSEEAQLLYFLFPGLEALHIVMGVTSLLLAGLAIFTRFMLTGLKRFAPWIYLGAYLLNVLQTAIYWAVLSGITKISIWELAEASDLSQIIVSLAMIVVNFIYFKHRMNAFKN